jgi:hypothetical protein
MQLSVQCMQVQCIPCIRHAHAGAAAACMCEQQHCPREQSSQQQVSRKMCMLSHVAQPGWDVHVIAVALSTAEQRSTN